MEEVYYKKELHIMRFKYNEVIFEVTCEDHSNYSKHIFEHFEVFWWSSNVASQLTSLCLSLIISSSFMNILHSPAVWLFDIWKIIGHSLKYFLGLLNVFSECIYFPAPPQTPPPPSLQPPHYSISPITPTNPHHSTCPILSLGKTWFSGKIFSFENRNRSSLALTKYY